MFLKMLAFFAATSWVAWMLMFMGFQTKRESRQRSETEHTRTTGTIIGYARGEHRSGRRGVYVYWKPVVEFLAEGQKYRAEYPNRMDRKQFPIGTEVEILYDVSDPLHFHLEADPVFTDPGGGAIRMSTCVSKAGQKPKGPAAMATTDTHRTAMIARRVDLRSSASSSAREA